MSNQGCRICVSLSFKVIYSNFIIFGGLFMVPDGFIGDIGQTNLRICICIDSKCNTNDLSKDFDLSTTPLPVHDYDRDLPTTINNAVTLSFSYSRLLNLIIKITLTLMLLNLT